MANIASALDVNITDSIHNATEPVRAEAHLVWSLGLLFVTAINMCALVGIVVMRYLSKHVYNQMITFFVGLGVGSLSGSSFYHLLPQATPRALDDRESHAYLEMAHFSVLGVYAFFFADRLIKMFLERKKRPAVTSSSEWPTRKVSSEMSGRSDVALLSETAKEDPAKNEIEMKMMKDKNAAGNNQKGDSAIASMSFVPLIFSSAVAWMIIFGDGLHNLIDGISIGASFNESIWGGVAVSIAVLAEEFPHELGDVAILVASGMTLRQAFLYNLLSALTCYVGFVIGVLIGELGHDTNKYAFALAGGMFLYISLSCMMPEMKREMEEALQASFFRGVYVFCLQSAGIFTGLTLMYVMARYGFD